RGAALASSGRGLAWLTEDGGAATGARGEEGDNESRGGRRVRHRAGALVRPGLRPRGAPEVPMLAHNNRPSDSGELRDRKPTASMNSGSQVGMEAQTDVKTDRRLERRIVPFLHLLLERDADVHAAAAHSGGL